MGKDTVIFYLSHYLAVKDLTNEQLGRLYRALFEKQLQNNSETTQKEVVLEDDIKIAFNFINNQMLVDEKKYLEKSKKLSENGKKGGAPKGNKNASKTTKQPKTSKTTLNDNDNVNDNDNDNVNVVVYNDNNNIITYMEDNGFVLYPADLELIKNWEDNEITRYAIKQAVLNKKFSTKYVERIIMSYKSKGIKTVSDALRNDEEFSKNKESNQLQRKKQEAPEWIDKKIEDEPLTMEEQEELENILKDFKN